MIIVDQIASETHLVDVYVQMDLYFLMADVFQVMEVTVLLIVFPMEDNVYVLMDISNMMESHVLFVQLVKSSFVDNV
jgi:predicted regulator of amino acid metabolism with ACT domain